MIIPGMIFSGNHVTKDIPKIINKFQKENKQVKISISLPLIKLKNFFNLIKKNINSEIKRIKKNNKTILILVASNTLNVEAKKEMKEVLKKLEKYKIKLRVKNNDVWGYKVMNKNIIENEYFPFGCNWFYWWQRGPRPREKGRRGGRPGEAWQQHINH